LTLSGEQTIDGVAVVAEQRVLVKDQSNSIDNGVYICKSGEWERADDFNQRHHATQGTEVFVVNGTTNAQTEWYVTTTGDPVPGQEVIAFAQLVPSASNVPFTPTGTISAINVQDAVEEMDAEKQPLDTDLTAIAALTTTSFGRAFLTYASEAAFKAATNLEANTDFYAPSGTDVAVADGGSGRSAATAYALICGGTTSTAAHQSVAGLGSSGQVLTSNGAAALPTFQDAGGNAASQIQMEAASATNVFSSPGRQHFHPGHPKAGGSLNGSGTPAFRSGDYGMGAVADDAVGEWTLAFDTAFNDTNYWPATFVRHTSDGSLAIIAASKLSDTKTTSAFKIRSVNSASGATLDSTEIGITFWGDYA
jgi:hypothetical protein